MHPRLQSPVLPISVHGLLEREGNAVIALMNVDRASAEQYDMRVLQDMGRVIVSDINAAMLDEGKQRYGMP